MMVHDQYGGNVQQVPDHLMGYGLGEVVYDGFGNAIGWNPFDTISQAVTGAGNLVRGAVQGVGNAVGNLAQGAGNIVGQAVRTPFNLVGQGVNAMGQGVNAAGQILGSLIPGMPGFPTPPGFPPGGPPFPSAAGGSMYPQFPYRPPMYGGFPRPSWPTGWQRPQLPYTGLGPQRMYMRCAVWPGPRGLVPGYAANAPGGLLPGMPGAPGMPGMPGVGGGRRHRRRRR